nr:flagellin [Comamonas terrigena]
MQKLTDILQRSRELAVQAASCIVDADYAVETAQLAQQQILRHAGTAMLAQAHSVVAEQALALLKDV